MVLSKNDIELRCTTEKLLENYVEHNIQTCSYDLRLGDQYYFYKKGDEDPPSISFLKPNGILRIPPNAICYVMTEEAVNMPADLTASISLSFGLIKKGVMLAAQPPYDPGYHGKTVALLHNLSNDYVEIERGAHILNIVFMKLETPVDKFSLYKGSYQGLTNLNEYCKKVKVGAVFQLKEDLEKERKKVRNLLPHILTTITVIIAILTVLFSVLIGLIGFSNLRRDSPSEIETASNVSSYPKFTFDRESNTLTVSIDGKNYVVVLEEPEVLPQKQPDVNK